MDYAEYLDPRWTTKRQEILKLRNYKCQCCYGDSVKFEIHHIDYKHNKHVWEYDADELVCLCQNCHEELHSVLSSFRELVARFDIHEMEDYRQIIFLLSMLDHSRSKLLNQIFQQCMAFEPEEAVQNVQG